MKTCSKCKQQKNIDEFNKNKSKRDGYSGVCRDCQKLYKQAHYVNNKDKVYAAARKRQQELRDKVWAYKNDHKCVDCDNSDPRVLEFDHLGDKEFNIAGMASDGYGWDRILKEIEKCEVVCANCHRIRTMTRGNWVRNMTVDLSFAMRA